MRPTTVLLLAVVVAAERVAALQRDPRRRDRGDVPGWVMIVVMTAALVATLLAVAGPKLTSVFDDAIDAVSR